MTASKVVGLAAPSSVDRVVDEELEVVATVREAEIDVPAARGAAHAGGERAVHDPGVDERQEAVRKYLRGTTWVAWFGSR